jgi:hypothetical protein
MLNLLKWLKKKQAGICIFHNLIHLTAIEQLDFYNCLQTSTFCNY